MKKIVITIGEGNSKSIEIDGKIIPIECFFLTTAVTGRSAGHFITYGNSDTVGQMLYNFFDYCVKENFPEMAETLELVAQDILDAAKTSTFEHLVGKDITH